MGDHLEGRGSVMSNP